MPQTNVSSCVLSIIASFSSGLDVFKKLRDTGNVKKRKVKKKNGRPPTQEEVKLARSLRQGPEDIGREYQRSIQILGDEFAIGDTIAQTSLAEVLLKLNTGLVNIINTFLSHETRDAQLSCQSLTTLSENSRIDTCRTLRQLYRRMLHFRSSPVPPFPEHNVREASGSRTSFHDGSKRKKTNATAKYTKVRAPMIARVVVENSARPSQIALVKPGERKKRSERHGTSPRPSPVSLPVLKKPASTSELTGFVEDLPLRLANPSFGAAHSTPNLDHTISLEKDVLSPASLSVPSTRLEPRKRRPTPTYYSIASGSTRLGEIPMHKWSEPYDFDAMSMLNREAARNGWPVENFRAPDVMKKRRFGIFRLFRKNDIKA